MDSLIIEPLKFLETRLSVASRELGEPGPDAAASLRLFTAAIRVPDHGKLVPFRLLAIRGDARLRLGETLAEIHARSDPNASPSQLNKDRERYRSAPLIVCVIARVENDHAKVPPQEQILSAGCVAYNLLLGAQALGFGAQWLTGWAAYDAEVAALLGLGDSERVIGFVHIGTPRGAAPERVRPALDDLLSEWNG